MNQEQEYRIRCAEIEPSIRLKKCFELSKWAKKTNKFIDIEIKRRLEGFYLLK